MSDFETELAWMLHDKVTVMQAAWIEWKRGRGSEFAMQWIENTLDGPDLLPIDAEVDAQTFYDRNRSFELRERMEAGS